MTSIKMLQGCDFRLDIDQNESTEQYYQLNSFHSCRFAYKL